MLSSPRPAVAGARIKKAPAEWRRELRPARFQIRRQAVTGPRPSPLDRENKHCPFTCARCALPLFSSSTKLASGTRWPSFYRGWRERSQNKRISLFTNQTEILCATCGGQLGHVFPDGPDPTGMRYCVNGLALQFMPRMTT
jgi:peptide-methionine (R)-S-oxide reductase